MENSISLNRVEVIDSHVTVQLQYSDSLVNFDTKAKLLSGLLLSKLTSSCYASTESL